MTYLFKQGVHGAGVKAEHAMNTYVFSVNTL